VPSLEETYEGYARDPRKRRAWDSENPGNRAIRAEVLEAVLEMAAKPIAGEGAILDIGCGSGWLLKALCERGVAESRIHGIDLLPARVDAALAGLPNAEIRWADARRLPFGDGAFALVTMLTVLSSMPERGAVRRALEEVRRVLAPRGLLLVYEPRVPNPLNRATRLVGSREVGAVAGPMIGSRLVTGLPPVARRLGRLTPRAYSRLSRLAPTHRLMVYGGTIPAG
jgi:ubiquinone/menaquinone biosynthesis C-methylase UbiE